nr:hypothetical protein [Tanacetum cinerariifolium]
MTSFDYRLNPLYLIKECLSYGALYTMDYCCSIGILKDKIICDLDKTPDLSQQSPQNCSKCGHPINDSFKPSNDNSNVANALREPFVVNQDPGNNSSQSPPQINHYCCYGCGDPLEGIFCNQCTCKLCGNGAHYGYNCPSKVPIIPNPEPFNNQTIKELPPTVQSFDPKSDLVHNSPNVFNPPPQLPFIPCEFYGNDARYGHYCTPQVPFVYSKPCYNQDFNFSQEFHDFQQQDLCCENYGVTHEAYQCQPKNEDYYHEQNFCYYSNSFGFDQFRPQQYTVNHPVFNEEEKKIKEEQAAKARYWKIPACYEDDDDYAFAITPNEPVNSLSMGNEHLDTILATKLDEFIKSSVENFIPIPNESEGEPEYDMPVCEEFTTFLNILFDAEELLYDNSSPRPPKDFISENSDAEIESFSPSHIHVEDSDSLMEEIDLTFTPHYPIPSGIEDNDCDSEREILILKDLLSNDTLSLPEKESFHFDIPLFSCHPSKPPDGNTGILNIKMMGDISDQKVPMPKLMITLVLNQEKSPDLLSHQGHKAFRPSAKCLMMIHGKNTLILDVPLFHFYPP